MKKVIFIVFSIIISTLVACKEKSRSEKIKDKVEDVVDDIEDTVEDVTDETEDVIDDVGKKVKIMKRKFKKDLNQ